MHQISPTILNQFRYMMHVEDDEQSARVRADLLAHLRGDRTEPNEAMLQGQQFEDDVCDMAEGRITPSSPTDPYSLAVAEAADIVRGSLCQQHVARELDGVLLHGYVDFMRAARMWDTKWATKTPTIPKYQHSMQHRLYLYCCEPMQIGNFAYLICDGRNLYAEEYHWHPSFEGDLRSAIGDWFLYLDRDAEMRQAYEARSVVEAA